MKQKFLCALLTLVFMFTCFSFTANAQESRIIKVTNLNEITFAAENCQDGDLIILSDDIYSDKILSFDLWGKKAVLDLNGHTLEIRNKMSNAVRINGFGAELTITDSKKSGALKTACLYLEKPADGDDRDTAAIRVSNSMQKLILSDVTVEALGGAYGPGIGASTAEVGSIIIKNSDVSATGGIFGAGIGGGFERKAGNIIIESGNIAAQGGNFAAGIGTGGFTGLKDTNVSDSILITGGNILSRGGTNAAGIGGGQLQTVNGIKIEDGKISAFGGNSGAGIGTGKMNTDGVAFGEVKLNINGTVLDSKKMTSDETSLDKMSFNTDGYAFNAADIFINGGNIKACGGKGAAGIGTGEGSADYLAEAALQNRLIKIDGGNVVSSGGEYGAGIGGGAYFSGGRVEIAESADRTYLEALGGKAGAGIGGGLAGLTGLMIRVYDGMVLAKGGDNAAGIGSGEFSLNRLEPNSIDFINLKNIVVTGGKLSVTGGKNAAAIGGGSCGSGSDVIFSGTALVRAESEYENSIGAGAHAVSQGSVTIDGGNIIINNKMGPIPRNSRLEPLYEGEIKVVSSILDMPVENVEIQAELSDYKYRAVTEQDGSAHVYLPRSEAALLVFANGSDKEYTRAEYEGDNLEIVLNEEKVKILSDEYTYFTDLQDNTFQIEYAGGSENLRFSLGGDTPIAINAVTGLMTFPVQLKNGSYNFPIYAYDGDTLLDTVEFKLTAVESLSGIKTEENDIQIAMNEKRILKINPEPEHNAVSQVFWKVTASDAKGYLLEDKFEEKGEYCAQFSAQLPGRYAVTATLVDINKNTASETFNIIVPDPYEIDTRALTVMSANGQSITRDLDYTSQYPPEINAWYVDRINAAKVYIDFYASCAGEYFYEVVKAGRKRADIYEGGYTAFEGNNRIEFDLPDAGAYEFYVVLEDKGRNASETVKIYVDEFNPPDIVPPELTDFNILRDKDTAYVSFISDKEGFYRYTAYENGISAVSAGESLSIAQPMSVGENTFTVNNLDSVSFCDITISAFDTEKNYTPRYAFLIEAFEEPVGKNIVKDNEEKDIALDTGLLLAQKDEAIELSEDFVITAGDSVMIGIVSNAPGEYFYEIADGNSVPQVDTSGKGALLAEGKNAIQLNGLSDDISYRVGITAKNEDLGTGTLIVEIPAEKPAVNITGLSVKRETPSRASAVFFSDKDGIINYTLMREGDGLPESYNHTEIIYEGRNKIYIDDIAGNEEFYFVAVAQDTNGKYGKFIKTGIGRFE